MRRKRYEFKITLTTSFLAYPNRVMKEHDKLARAIIGAVEEKVGGKTHSVQDCKTGRFRSLKEFSR